jgi:hypothetical protein
MTARETAQSQLLATAVALFFASFAVVANYAGEEPYDEFRHADALINVGLGTALIACWLVWSAACVGLALRRVIARTWLACLLLPVLCIFYLQFCPLGYLEDMDFVLRPAR